MVPQKKLLGLGVDATGAEGGATGAITGATLGAATGLTGAAVGVFPAADKIAISAQFQKFSEAEPHERPGVGQLLAV